jgi:3-phenylpropionate/trans-cinnamate dioxygenase ferredoxin reductase component
VRSVVVVGGSLAGLSAAEQLRSDGFDGDVVIVGAEPHRPYDRPPLSKEVLVGKWGPERTALRPEPRLDELGLEWELGRRATHLDLVDRRVALDDGRRLDYDGLVIATGAVPRRLPGAEGLAGVHVLRTLEDCLALRAELEAGPGRVVVIGAGFIGGEVAASARTRGLEVTVLEALPAPMVRVLGEELGAFVADVHRDHGVEVRCGVGVDGFVGDGRVEGVRLGDGTVVEADVVVVGIGVTPDTAWLHESGLSLADGVVCDDRCLAAPGVVAAGDVARWPHPVTGVLVRVEHWDNAIHQGTAAARRLLAGDGPCEPFRPVPWFWSDQYDRKFQVLGWWNPHGAMRVVDGSIADRAFVAVCERDGMVGGVLGVNRARLVAAYRARLEDGLPWDDPAASDPAALVSGT